MTFPSIVYSSGIQISWRIQLTDALALQSHCFGSKSLRNIIFQSLMYLRVVQKSQVNSRLKLFLQDNKPLGLYRLGFLMKTSKYPPIGDLDVSIRNV